MTACAIHGDVLEGRDFCPACRDRFAAVLDALDAEEAGA